MKQLFKIILSFCILFHAKAIFAVDDAWILGGGSIGNDDQETCITGAKLRSGDVHLEDFPCMINGMINIFMGFSATIAVIFIIIWAYQILFGSLEIWSKTKWKETIIMALGWFALAAFSWLIIRFILDNFS